MFKSFIPNYSTISKPFAKTPLKECIVGLIYKSSFFFIKLKNAFENPPKLAYYNVNKGVISINANSHVMGGIPMLEGRPVAY